MSLKFKLTKIAATLVCIHALSSLAHAQENRATIQLTSPNQYAQTQDEQLPHLQEQNSIAPEADANTMPLLRLASQRIMNSANEFASPAVFTVDNLGDPNHGFTERAGFTIQQGGMPVCVETLITPGPMMRQPTTGNHQLRSSDRTNSRALSDEYIYDGDDRGKKIGVDQNWNIYGMETEDTFGHFDTVDGRRLVSPSNRVKIYAPRFAAVRKLDGVFNARRSTRVGSFDKKLVMQVSRGKDFSSSTMQNIAIDGMEASKRASGFVDRTRGVVADQAIELIGVRNSFSPYENLELIKWGRHSGSQTARLELGMQAANVWQDNLRLKVNVKGAQPIVVNDLSSAQQIIHVKSDGKGSVLRVTKVASKIAADQGDEVEFTIRFDNLSSKPVGNVTLVDNLTGRLQYIPGSAECSLKAKFIDKVNEANSLTLRWEIIDPVKPHKGGIIRFKCKVR